MTPAHMCWLSFCSLGHPRSLQRGDIRPHWLRASVILPVLACEAVPTISGRGNCHTDIGCCCGRHLVGISYSTERCSSFGKSLLAVSRLPCVCIRPKRPPSNAIQKHSRQRATRPSTTSQATANPTQSSPLAVADYVPGPL
jgi:hypothetical protein